MKFLVLFSLVALAYAAPPVPKTIAVGDKTITVGDGVVDISSPFNTVHIQKAVDPITGDFDLEITVSNPFAPAKSVHIHDDLVPNDETGKIGSSGKKEKRATKPIDSQFEVITTVLKKYNGTTVTDAQFADIVKKIDKYVTKGLLHKVVLDVFQAVAQQPAEPAKFQPGVTPVFSVDPTTPGAFQINTPWFSSKINKPASPFEPSTFEFKTPFTAVQPVGVAPLSTIEQVQQQGSIAQQTALTQLIQQFGQQNVQTLFNILVGDSDKVTPIEYQQLQQQLVGINANQTKQLEELLGNFAGEKFTFPSQYGQKVVTLPQIDLSKVLEQVRQKIATFSAVQYENDDGSYFQSLLTKYPELYNYFYGQQQRFAPQQQVPYPFGQQTVPYSGVPYYQIPYQRPAVPSYYPGQYVAPQPQYLPYQPQPQQQQYAQGYQQYQPSYVPAY